MKLSIWKETLVSAINATRTRSYPRITCTGGDLYVRLTGRAIAHGAFFDKCLFNEIIVDEQFGPNGHVHRLVLIGNDQLMFDDRIGRNRIVDRREGWTDVEISLHADEGGVLIEMIDLKSTSITVENGYLHRTRREGSARGNDVSLHSSCRPFAAWRRPIDDWETLFDTPARRTRWETMSSSFRSRLDRRPSR